MASIPPIVAEDQTDEDFFDKLVEDSFGFEESRSGSEDVAESDNAMKASENVGMCNAGTFFQGSDDLGLNSAGEGPSNNEIEQSSIAPEKDVSALGEGTSLVTSNSFSFDDPETVLGDPAPVTTDVALVSSSTMSSGSRGMAIKEVEWSAFNSELAQPETGRSGSYTDFFNELADNSVDSFAEVGIKSKVNSNTTDGFTGNLISDSATSSSLPEQQQSEYYGTVGEQIQDGQQLDGSQYWESLYPGWKFDAISGQWYQVDGYNVAEPTQMDSVDKDQSESVGALDHRSQLSHLQQTTQSVAAAVVENCTTGCVSNWTQDSNGSIEYPSNMVFDPQYPGWYYDTIAQEWRLLESYAQTGAVQMSTDNEQPAQDGNASLGGFSEKEHGLYTESNHLEQQYKSQAQGANWAGSGITYAQSGMWQSEPVANGGAAMGFARSKQAEDLHSSIGHVDNCADQKRGFKKMESISFYAHADNSYDSHSGETGFQSFASAENLYHYNQQKVEECQQSHASSDYYGNQKSLKYDQQPIHTRNTSNIHKPYVQNEARSSAGRPPHALVSFGFGGKLVVLKDSRSSFEDQGSAGGSISILNLIEVVADKMQASSLDTDAYDYFHALCQQSFPGPVVGGNPAAKELYKWIDERIANCQSPNMDSKKGELLRLLHSLLKICCQHYGKLRSPFGVDSALQETDSPELAVAKLFASAKKNGAQLSNYGDISHCMQNLPTEGQIQTTAVEVEYLLVSGRRKEALHCAQAGQLWGPALVLAAQLGEKFYVDTVKQMAHRQFVPGSPLRTLCLLIAGQPADVFSGDSSINASPFSPVELPQQPAQFLANGMLDDWEENLAIITANRTKDDELVIIHLGDCLWKERGQITAAHTCYLVAEANFESYSDTARLCLIGADHWKCPRTYVSPEAIQRTELYEYSKVLGNSQFILLPFQPYKLIYAHMLAEVGKVSESLRYCQAILKTLKNSGRAPEVETWKSLLSSLEERIKTHQQGGYSTNLAPAKLVGKLFNSIDRSIHRMIGTPPPLPSPTQSSSLNSEYDNQSNAKKVANSQSTMAMSSLVPSASMEPISEWAGDNNRMTMHNRSMSEPDFSRSPKQVSPKKQPIPAGGKSSIAGGPSRFGRFGSQLLQKTMGWVSRSRQDRQAKLGEKNKFYYDEKLKRWVEEGAEPPTEEAALPPPPTTAPFQNSASEKSQSLPSNGMLESKSPNSSEHSKGLPPIPPSTNQFSARGRMGVRSRYVDTFNKNGGINAKFFQSPPIQAAKPAGGAKFFVPTPSSSVDQTVDATGESIQDVATSEDFSASAANESSYSSISSTPPPLQRFPSMNNIAHITNKGVGVSGSGDGSAPYHSRAASWSGSYNDMFYTKANETKPLGKALGMPLSSFMMPSDPSPMRTVNGGSSRGDLHKVEL